MIEFRKNLRERLVAKVTEYVGPATPEPNVKLIDQYLHAVETYQLPFVVTYVRQIQNESEGEIGTPFTQDIWEVHIYYLDKNADRIAGEDKMDNIIGDLVKKIKKDRYLGHLNAVDTEGNETYVYDTKVTSVLFDSSGQEGDYSFVSEVYLNVYTDNR